MNGLAQLWFHDGNRLAERAARRFVASAKTTAKTLLVIEDPAPAGPQAC